MQYKSYETVPPSESTRIRKCREPLERVMHSGHLAGRPVKNRSQGTVDMPKKTKGSKSATAGGSVPDDA